MDSEMESKVRELEVVQEIINLEADYCYASDNYDGDAFADLFTEDGILVGTPVGKIEGREALRELCRDQLPQGFSFAMHFLHNPRIAVAGDIATGKFYWQASLTHPDPSTATNAAGTYDCKYVRTDSGWKIKEKVIKFFYNTPYDKGWVEKQFYGQDD